MSRRRLSWLVMAWGLDSCIRTASFTPADTKPAMLSPKAFARVEGLVNLTGRPLERALFAFHFAREDRSAVIGELAKFQNHDGGFASYIESDTRWRGSSPMGTMIGLRILNEVHVPADDPQVRAAVGYLLATFDDKAGYWHALPKEVNTAPHAPWWGFNEKTGKCDVESPVFPTGAIAGYMRRYSGLVPSGFLARITQSSLRDLSAAPVEMEMPDIEMLTDLVPLLPQNQSTEAVRKLRAVLAAVVVRDPKIWRSYGVQPLTFIPGPDSPFYSGFENDVATNLDYLISTQENDCGWPLTWSWEQNDPAAWAIAKREWRGVVTLQNLERLESFHRIARESGVRN